MNPIVPPVMPAGATRVNYAVHQAEYRVLPATIDRDGVVMHEWVFTAEELARILEGGRLRVWTITFGEAFQPVQLEIVPTSTEV